jgi:hypothetical protein
MKKVKLTGKLSLNKETVTKLNNEQMNSINGGYFTIPSGVITLGGNCSAGCTISDVCGWLKTG